MDPFIGEIRLMGFKVLPRGWAECNGQMLSIAQNQALFSILGTYYGGDGRNTFALPDLRDRNPVGMGAGPNRSPRNLGQTGGKSFVTLDQTSVPQHTHAVYLSNVAGTVTAPANNVAPGAVARRNNVYIDKSGQVVKPMKDGTVGSTGGGQPHENRQPGLGLRFCISLLGIFPSRS